MTNKTPERKTAEEIVREIFYSPATNGQAETSIANGIKLVEQYASQSHPKEAEEGGSVEELKKKFIKLLGKVELEQGREIAVCVDRLLNDKSPATRKVIEEDKWISVDAGLKPKDDQWVHCAAFINGAYDVLLPAYSYSKKYKTFTAYGEAQWDGRITHWQPLPLAPLITKIK